MYIEPNIEIQTKLKFTKEDLGKTILFCPDCDFQHEPGIVGVPSKCPNCKSNFNMTKCSQELLDMKEKLEDGILIETNEVLEKSDSSILIKSDGTVEGTEIIHKLSGEKIGCVKNIDIKINCDSIWVEAIMTIINPELEVQLLNNRTSVIYNE